MSMRVRRQQQRQQQQQQQQGEAREGDEARKLGEVLLWRDGKVRVAVRTGGWEEAKVGTRK